MPNNKKSDYDLIPWREVFEEQRKDPACVKAYDSLEEEFAEIYRKIEAKNARIARRKALVKRVWGVGAKLRGFWASLMRGMNRIVY